MALLSCPRLACNTRNSARAVKEVMRKRPKRQMTNTNLHVRRKHAAVESCYVTAIHVLLGDAWPACHELLDVLQFKEAAVKAVILLRDLSQLTYEAKCEVQAQREIPTALLLRSSYLWPQERKAAVAVAEKRLRKCVHREGPFV